jgi:hypothetical protein
MSLSDSSSSPRAFFSYAHFDDMHEKGRITELCKELANEVQFCTGKKFEIFLDRNDIRWGQAWKDVIGKELERVAFFIAIVTPTYFESRECAKELKSFLNRENTLGNNNLVFPLYYADIPERMRTEKKLINRVLTHRQYVDWRKLRYSGFDEAQFRIALNGLGKQVLQAIEALQNLDTGTFPE